MKKLLILAYLLCFAYYLCDAQTQAQSKDERLQSLKIAYITKELNLTAEEAKQFWPVYNKYFEEVKKARHDHSNDEIAFEEEVVSIKKRYRPDFKTILKDDDRVNKTFMMEKSFRDFLRKELQQRQKKP